MIFFLDLQSHDFHPSSKNLKEVKEGKKNDFNQLQVEIVQPIKKTKDFVVVVIPLFCFSVFLLFPNRTVNKSVYLIIVDLNKDQ